MFVGYPRSGHSLVGHLLDAHPDTLVAPELDALRYLQAGFTRSQIYYLLLERVKEVRRQQDGAPGSSYSYAVPGQWQGSFENLRVIGDKKGGGSALRFGMYPNLYSRFRTVIDDRVRFIHVIRNPYDNIATLSRRRQEPLSVTTDRYFFMCDSAVALQSWVEQEEWHELRHEDLISEPRRTLTDLCHFVGVAPLDGYLEACCSIIYASPHRSRFDVEWPPPLLDQIATRCSSISFLRNYRHDSDGG